MPTSGMTGHRIGAGVQGTCSLPTREELLALAESIAALLAYRSAITRELRRVRARKVSRTTGRRRCRQSLVVSNLILEGLLCEQLALIDDVAAIKFERVGCRCRKEATR